MPQNRKVKVLIVDDSPLVRRLIADCLQAQPDIEIAGAAVDPYEARDLIVSRSPDVITLDLELPRMHGLDFLDKLMRHHPLPVIVISSLSQTGSHVALDALRRGAVEVLGKPNGPDSFGHLKSTLPRLIHAAAGAKLDRRVASASPTVPRGIRAEAATPAGTILCIGASTGGVEAIERVLVELPPTSPGILIAQHIPPVFSRTFAERLDRVCQVRVKEAEPGDVVRDGLALVAPGDYHMMLVRRGGHWAVDLNQGPRVCYQRPSVDVTFQSVANHAAPAAVGVILTGMGSDGATGLKLLRDRGCWTIAQDESSSVVYGMPAAAVEAGAVCESAHLTRIPGLILAALRKLPMRIAAAPAQRSLSTAPPR